MKNQLTWMQRLVIVAVLLLICTVLFSACNQGLNNPSSRPSGSSKETSKVTDPYGDAFNDKESTSNTDQAEPHVHEFGEWAVTTKPTCTAAGEESRSCSCGEVETQTIEATGHSDINNDNICDICQTVRLAAGLYDTDNNMVASWKELVSTYGMNVEANYSSVDIETSSPSYILNNKKALANGVHLVIGDIEAIGSLAFFNCANLSSIAIPDSVTSIGNSAFSGCSNLTSVYITDIAAWCNIIFDYVDANPLCYAHNLYLNNELVTDLIIPDSIARIASRAFEGCTSLTSVTIPDSVWSINQYAFLNCTGLTSVTIPYSVTHIQPWVFKACTSLTSITVDENNTQYYSEGNCLIEKSTNTLILGCKNSVIPDSVTSIDEYAFQNCTGLTSVTIPDSVTSIDEYAFQNCTGLTSVTIPYSVTIIDEHAFQSCTSLTSIAVDENNTQYYSEGNCLIEKSTNTLILGCKNSVIPNSVTSIGKYAFYDCSSLTSIVIPDSVTSIDEYAFNRCYKLIEVYNLSSLNISIGSGDNGYIGFYALNVYTSVDIPSKLWKTEDGFIFYEDEETCYLVGYTGAKPEITLPESCNGKNYAINESAFYGCTSLTSVTIPDSVTSIGSSAFHGCTSLTNVTMGNSVTSIGNDTFMKCTSLTSVNIPDSVTSIGANAFWYCTSLTSINIPDSVTSIGGVAFLHCTSLTSINIPSSVTSIGHYTFSHCTNLTSIIIPDSVTSIGDRAFYSCNKIKTIYYSGTSKKWNTISIKTFNECLTSATRYYHSEMYPSENGNYWHYVNGVPTVWDPNNIATITVKYNFDLDLPKTLILTKGSNATMLPSLTADGYVFIDWYADAEFTKPFTINGTYTINEDITLYAYFRKILSKPESKTYTYNGETITFETLDLTGELYTIEGIYEATDAGEYTVTLTPTEKYCWSDNSIEPLTIKWIINKKTVAIPQGQTYTYSGEEFSLTTIDLTGKYYTVDGVYEATDAGEYTVKLTLDKNYCWDSKSVDNLTIKWTINKRVLTVEKFFDYTGESINIANECGLAKYCTVAGDVEAIKRGKYTAIIKIKNINACVWEDGTTSDKTIEWSIILRYWDGSVDTSWYNAEDVEFIIDSTDQLAGLAQLVNNGNNFEGIAILLNHDLHFSNKVWIPIGTSTSNFAGTFDGNGHTISNFKVTGSVKHAGLFGYSIGTIENLKVEKFNVRQHEYSNYSCLGGLLGYNGGIIENCYSAGAVGTDSNCTVGVLVGENVGTIKDCYAKGEVDIHSSCTVGILAGSNSGTIENSYTTGDIKNSYMYRGGDITIEAGGLVGSNYNTITNCYTTGDIEVKCGKSNSTPTLRVGGGVGYNRGTIKNCYATGNVISEASGSYYVGNYAGGLIGYNFGIVENCYARGHVTGYCYGEATSYRHGDVLGYVGGLVGYNYKANTITNCYATGDVTIKALRNGWVDNIEAEAGGLVGATAANTITNCYRNSGQLFNVTKDLTTSHSATNTYGTAKDMATLKSITFQANTLGWNPEIWNFVEGKHPTLKNVGTIN